MRYLIVFSLLLAGCAGFDGRGLVPGVSTAAEVEALMGPVAERRAGRDGESVLWFSRQPYGRENYAARIGADGKLVSLEQRLTVENVTHVVPNTWTKKEVRELFGPPFMVSTLPRLEREVWEYQLREVDFKWKLWVQFSSDGVVREVLQMRHPDMDPPGGDGGRA